MTDHICSQAQVDAIADSLNAGHRDSAMQLINACTADLVNGSTYAQDMQRDFSKFMIGDEGAMHNAKINFDRLAAAERTMWQSMKDAAEAKNPHGLCQLTIVDDKQVGPRLDISGKNCR